MSCRGLSLLVLVAATHAASVNTIQENQDAAQGHANPIRKVVTMLQNMQKKVTAEGEKEKALFDKFMCYCANADSTLGQSIATAEDKIPEVGTNIEEGTAKKAQLDDEVKAAISQRAEAKGAIAKATAIREKEAASFNKESAEYKSNIGAMKSAISAISSGMSGGFLQTQTAAMVRNIALNGPNMEDTDRQEVLAFLSGKQGESTEYIPKSGEITGILKTMEDEMSKTLADITADEKAAATSHDELVTAKTKEIQALSKAIETKSKRVGELAVEIVMMKNDLSDTEAALLEDKKFYGDLKQNCATKEGEWAEIQKMRAMEMVALADTIKILNDDDALEMFKKTLPGASAAGFLQVSNLRQKALTIITTAQKKSPGAMSLGFVMLALKGKKVGFEKVVKLIDDMVVVLKKEQVDDEVKKEYCTTQLDVVEDKKKGLEQSISDLETSIDHAKEGIASAKTEIETTSDGIRALDKSVAEATEQRKAEHEDHTELMAGNNAAKELLKFAKNRLNKFYNPKQYVAPPKRDLSFVQVSAHSQNSDEPAPAPEAPKAFEKKTEESGSVINMIDLLIADLDKESQTSTVEEKNAQKEYEKMMGDSARKRAEDSKLITEKTSMKAQLETELEESKEGKASATKELMATLEYTSSLHGECDWLLKNFDVRKEARASEVDALGNAKAVLSGADFSLVQKSSKFLGQ